MILLGNLKLSLAEYAKFFQNELWLYIYIYIERERERERDGELWLHISTCLILG